MSTLPTFLPSVPSVPSVPSAPVLITQHHTVSFLSVRYVASLASPPLTPPSLAEPSARPTRIAFAHRDEPTDT